MNQNSNIEHSTNKNFTPYIPSQYKTCLWNPTAIGDSVVLGSQNDNGLNIHCLERCLRLAHKHAIQGEEVHFQGFLLGSLEFDSDGVAVLVYLNRFDPGVSTESFHKVPSTILPNDIIVPIQLTKVKPRKNEMQPCCNNAEQFVKSFKMLRNTICSSTTLDLSQSLALSLHCVYDDHSSNETVMSNVLFHWTSVFMLNSVRIAPVKSVPIIPTALAKTLSNSLDLLQDEGLKSGFMTMDQTRKLLLMLESDPKVCQLQTVGIWISYISNVHHPSVWITCLRYIHSRSPQLRIMSKDGDFLLLLYSKPNFRPQFYKCSVDQTHQLTFDLLSAEHNLQLDKRFDQSHKAINITLDYSPLDGSLEREVFNNALEDYGNEIMQTSQNFSHNIKAVDHKITEKSLTFDSEVSKQNDKVLQNSLRLEPQPSPTPQLLETLYPSGTFSSVLEPSLIFDEVSKSFGQTSTIATSSNAKLPIHVFLPKSTLSQIDSDESLVPSFCEADTSQSVSANVKVRMSCEEKAISNKSFTPSSFSKSRHTKRLLSNSITSLNKTKDACYSTASFIPAMSTSNGDSQSSFMSRNCSSSNKSGCSNNSQLSGHSHSSSRNIDEYSWFKSLPCKVQNYILDQDLQINKLQQQIKILSEMHNSNEILSVDDDQQNITPLTRDVHSQTDGQVSILRDATTNTDLQQINSVCYDDVPHEDHPTDVSVTTSKENSMAKHEVHQLNEEAENEPVIKSQVVTNSSDVLSATTDRSNGWESASFHLDSSALNATNPGQSVTSSLQAIDMPGLDTSGDPTPRDHEMWSHGSPVLGESASMYAAARTNIIQKDDDRTKYETDEDAQFFGDLLKQVQDLLERGSGGKSDDTISQSNNITRSARCEKKMSGPLVPHLTYLSMLANRGVLGACDMSTLVSSSSGLELSMHANAIALKYLSDDQLERIASDSHQDPVLKIPSQSSSFLKNSSRSERYSGMNLLSPCNMSLATKKYMQKYGLVEIDDDDDDDDNDDEDKENVVPLSTKVAPIISSEQLNKSTLKRAERSSSLGRSKHDRIPLKSCSVHSRKTDDVTDKSFISRNSAPALRSKKGADWSDLQNNLEDTFDMLDPFLRDLEKTQQNLSEDEKCDVGSKTGHKEQDSGVGETMEQILSPRILQSLKKANKHLKLSAAESGAAKIPSRSSSNASDKVRNCCTAGCYESDSKLDAILMPPPQPVSNVDESSKMLRRSESAEDMSSSNRNKKGNHYRRMSSSPTYSNRNFVLKKDRHSQKTINEDRFERVLDSHIMQAFNRETVNSSSTSRDHSTDVTDQSPNKHGEEGNILNLNKIKSLPKLS